jgi:hypothetical protein
LEPPNDTLPADEYDVAWPLPCEPAPLDEPAIEPEAETEPFAAMAEPAPRTAVAAAIAISEVRIALLSLHHTCAVKGAHAPTPIVGGSNQNLLRLNNVIGTMLDRFDDPEPITVG